MKKILAASALALLAAALLAQRLLRPYTSPRFLNHDGQQIATPTSTSPGTSRAAMPNHPSASNSGSENQLPPALLASIETALPGYRLPDPSVGRHPYTEMCETNSSAFLTAGDFTGHGRQEFALILTNAELLRFAIFSADAAGQFHMLYLARPKTAQEWEKHSKESLIGRPEQIDLCKIPKGETWAPEGGDTVRELRMATDAVAIHTHPDPNYDLQSLVLYKNGAFQQVFFEPLVQLR